MKKNSKQIVAIIIALIIGFTSGTAAKEAWLNKDIYNSVMQSSTQTNTTQTTNTTNTNLNIFNGVYNTISKNWLDVSEKPIENLESAAIKGFFSALNDPYTMYFTAEEMAEFTASVDGSFCGIGVQYSMRDEGGLISEVLPDTPALKAGVKAGDLFTHIDGKSIEGLSSDEVKDMVTGPEGEKVVLTVLRDGETQDITIIRQKIDSSVFYRIMEIGNQMVGYLDINTFGDMTTQTIDKGLQYFKSEGIETLIIDLRDNTGGYLTSVENILDLFLDKDQLMFSIQRKTGPIQDYKAKKENPYVFNKGYVFVNEKTASASEVMSAGLSEQLGYTLIGKTTYGKGVAQTSEMLKDMTSIKYTYAKWLTPNGTCINGVGITPDIVVEEPCISDFYNIQVEQEISYDTVSENCLEMQRMLKLLGYDCKREDGYFSMDTKMALQSFEMDHNLEVDGIYDSKDNRTLISAIISYFDEKDHDPWFNNVLKEMR